MNRLLGPEPELKGARHSDTRLYRTNYVQAYVHIGSLGMNSKSKRTQPTTVGNKLAGGSSTEALHFDTSPVSYTHLTLPTKRIV